MEAQQVLENFYENYDEDGRLASRRGSVEFLTTLRYVERYLCDGMQILEIGAGTGRYSHYFARKGYCVDAVELVAHNIERFKANTQSGESVSVRQGNAVNLDGISADSYDLVLLLGPMYHLFTEADKQAALREAVRVAKPGGIVCVAYCMMDASILDYGFRRGNVFSLIKRGLLNPKTYTAESVIEGVFELYRQPQIDALIAMLPVQRLHFVGTDMYTKYIPNEIDQMDDALFAQYLAYHFMICERSDMVGISHHTLDVLRKNG